MRSGTHPSGQTVNEQRRAHCNHEDNDNADDEVLDHVFCIDLLFVAVRNGDLDADICAPNDDDRRKRDDE